MPPTPRGAPELVSAQAVPETTVNEQVRHTEAGACHFPVADKDLTAPPGACSDGANYIIAAAATGAWTGKATQLATALGTNAANGWLYHIPVEGFTAYVQDENARYLYGGAAWAIETISGGARASTTEQLTGTDAIKAATSDSVAALWEQGSDVASAAIVALDEGGYFAITGTTTITDIDFATDKAGRKAWVRFAGILTLTHNATTLILPTGASIVTAAGDTACFVSEGADAVRCVAYSRASGAPLVPSAGALLAANNLSDVASAATARRNLGVEPAPTTQTGTAYTAVLGNAGGYIQFTNAAAVAFTIPANASVAFAIGTVITVEQNGAGVVTLTPDAGVTLRSRGSLLATGGQYAVAQVKKVATDTWTVIGDVA